MNTITNQPYTLIWPPASFQNRWTIECPSPAQLFPLRWHTHTRFFGTICHWQTPRNNKKIPTRIPGTAPQTLFFCTQIHFGWFGTYPQSCWQVSFQFTTKVFPTGSSLLPAWRVDGAFTSSWVGESCAVTVAESWARTCADNTTTQRIPLFSSSSFMLNDLEYWRCK